MHSGATVYITMTNNKNYIGLYQVNCGGHEKGEGGRLNGSGNFNKTLQIKRNKTQQREVTAAKSCCHSYPVMNPCDRLNIRHNIINETSQRCKEAVCYGGCANTPNTVRYGQIANKTNHKVNPDQKEINQTE